MIAKYDGKCRNCGRRIHAGDEIDFRGGLDGAVHIECSVAAPKPEPKPEPVAPVATDQAEILEITAGRPPFTSTFLVALSCGHTTTILQRHEVGETIRCPLCHEQAMMDAETERARQAARRGGYTYVGGLGSVR